MTSRLAWAAWAVTPIFLLAFHFGPGQRAATLDRAGSMHNAALEIEATAIDAQRLAHEAHIDAIEAQRRAFLSESEADHAAAEAAIVSETAAYEAASVAWSETADVYQQIETVIGENEHASEITWAKARAMVRAGQIFNGIDELEVLLETVDADEPLARRTRQELAAAHYFGARILRLDGEPAETWRAVSSKARQHYRYLAETAEIAGDVAFADDMQRNVELVLDLEQQDQSELQGRPLPKNSPQGQANGDRPCDTKRKSKRPPQKRDGRGAGGTGRIGAGH